MMLATQIRAMGHGDHVCLIYNTFAEQVAALVPFVREGIDRGERCLYICDDRTAAEVAGVLESAGLEVEDLVRRGALLLLTKREAYLASGEFSPEAMLRVFGEMEAAALAEGHTGLRITGEMSWALGDEPGCERLMEYEALLNRYFPGSRALAICQYNRERFAPEVIEQVLQTHPVAVIGERVISNPFYEPPELFFGRAAAAARVEWKLSQLQRAHASEERIRDSEERYRLLVQGVPDSAMFWLDAQGRITSWNAGAERITGYSAGEVEGRHVSILSPEPDAADGSPADALRAARGLEQHAVDGWRRRRDGSRFRASETITARRDTEGDVLGYSVVLRDVTERRRSTALVAAQKLSLELVVAGAPLSEVLRHLARTLEEQAGGCVAASILLLDAQGRLRNGASPSLPEEYLRVIDGLAADAGICTCCAAAALAQPVVTPDFTTAPGWRGLSHLPLGIGFRGAWSMPILARDGSVLGTFGTYFRECREPTAAEIELVEVLARTASIAIERGRAEEALREREAFNRRLLESSGDCIKVLDLDGRLLSMNAAGQQLMGVADLRPLVGARWAALWRADDVAAAQGAVVAAAAGGEGRFEGFCPTLAGEPKWWDVVITPVPDAAGRPFRLLAISRDITERRRVEDELRRAMQAAEAADQAKGQFLAVMSHELRTPLTGIIGYADLLASDIFGPVAEEQRPHVARIKASAWHLVAIIDEILTFSRVEAGKEDVHREPVNLAALVAECADLLHPLAAAKGVRIRLATGEGPIELFTDAGKLRQILLNLAGNAVKFTDHGEVELSIRARGGEVELRVRDTGSGIPADKLEGIFEPFVQADQSNTRAKGGTGLGLTVCRSLARLLGGEVRVVESTPGAGSTFALHLPLSAAQLQPPTVVAPPLPA